MYRANLKASQRKLREQINTPSTLIFSHYQINTNEKNRTNLFSQIYSKRIE